ncbi:hypothetical protein, partial [Pseudomonas asplenii]
VEQGETARLFAEPQHTYTRALLGASSVLAEASRLAQSREGAW